MNAHSLADIQLATQEVQKTHYAALDAYTIQIIATGSAAGVYVWNLIDTAFTRPKVIVTVTWQGNETAYEYQYSLNGVFSNWLENTSATFSDYSSKVLTKQKVSR